MYKTITYCLLTINCKIMFVLSLHFGDTTNNYISHLPKVKKFLNCRSQAAYFKAKACLQLITAPYMQICVQCNVYNIYLCMSFQWVNNRWVYIKFSQTTEVQNVWQPPTVKKLFSVCFLFLLVNIIFLHKYHATYK